MTLRNRGEPPGSRLAAPVMAIAMRRANRKDLREIKRILEGSRGRLAAARRRRLRGERGDAGGHEGDGRRRPGSTSTATARQKTANPAMPLSIPRSRAAKARRRRAGRG